MDLHAVEAGLLDCQRRKRELTDHPLDIARGHHPRAAFSVQERNAGRRERVRRSRDFPRRGAPGMIDLTDNLAAAGVNRIGELAETVHTVMPRDSNLSDARLDVEVLPVELDRVQPDMDQDVEALLGMERERVPGGEDRLDLGIGRRDDLVARGLDSDTLTQQPRSEGLIVDLGQGDDLARQRRKQNAVPLPQAERLEKPAEHAPPCNPCEG